MRPRTTVLLALGFPIVLTAQSVPQVVGPVSGPGSVFFTTIADLEARGYVEEEFFLEGEARSYEGDSFGEPVPYRTRLVVRRPTDPAAFNGVVVVEMLNVAVGYDIDIDWIYAHEHFLRSGYAWVGVSARTVGVHGVNGLRAWNPARYESLDLTADSVLLDDQLRNDVYLQAATALRRTGSALGPLEPDVLIATGHSGSSGALVVFLGVAPEASEVFDAFMLHGGGGPVPTDVDVPVMRVNTEVDLWRMGQAAARQEDTELLRTWEIAGAAHIDEYYMSHVNALAARDLGAPITLECDRTPLTRVPFRAAFSSAFDHLVNWVRGGDPPPTAPRIELVSQESPIEAERDAHGNARGGIRLPEIEVPLATNGGRNAGGAWCSFAGSYEPFPTERIEELYPTSDSYLRAYSESVRRNVEAGYILEADAEALIAAARARIGGIE